MPRPSVVDDLAAVGPLVDDADQMKSAPVVMPWLIITRSVALETRQVEEEDAQGDKAHVGHAGVGDQLLHVGLAQADEAAVDDGRRPTGEHHGREDSSSPAG